MSFFRKNTTTADAGLIDLTKKAAVSLDKHGLNGLRAAVYLVLDHSGSMDRFYRDGSVQHLTEQILALSANLDDDGDVPVSFFHHGVDHTVNVRVDNYAGIIDREHRKAEWGGTNYAPAMNAVVRHHCQTGAQAPALVVFQTDGEPGDRADTEQRLRQFSTLPIFWNFVGFGGSISFLERLDDLTGRHVDNASFFHAQNPHAVTDEQLYDGITREFAQWLTTARAVGIVR